jgi:hypothetical protein
MGIEDDSIAHLHPDRHATIQTGRVYADLFAGKEPADRQRFKSSLAKPLLLALVGDTIMVREVVERGKGGDEVCIWKQPSWDPCLKEIMEGLPPLFNGYPQLGSDLRIVRGLTGLNHTCYDDVEGLIQDVWFAHNDTPLV